jgi:hypothetical protein
VTYEGADHELADAVRAGHGAKISRPRAARSTPLTIICCRREATRSTWRGHFVYPSPRSDTAAFLVELERIAQEHEIDVIVPAFEETFYISTQIARLSQPRSSPRRSARWPVCMTRGSSSGW